MGLEGDGITVASHLTTVAVLVALVARMLRAELHDVIGAAARRYGLALALALGAGALAIERLYYVAARLLRRDGVDLWTMHPAPELLSLIVTAGLYGITVPIVLASHLGRAAALRRVAIDAAALGLFWLAAALVLR